MRIATNPTLLLRLAVFTALLLPLGCGDDDRVPQDAVQRDGGEPDAPMPDGMVPDGVVMCERGLVDCGDGCTFLAGDSANCGACGVACPSGFSCAVGRCDCEEPMKSCDGSCTDPTTDNNNCGMCGNACREGDICLEGACVVGCEAPDQRCPGTESEYICSDPLTDSLNCSVCGAACSSGAECVRGSCSCGEGQISCGGSCVDPTTDAAHCGDCLTNCGVDGVCMDGGCSTCGAGLTACGEVARCTDTDTSRLHCGECDNTCGPGAGCTAGACACLPGFTDCDGECAALPSNPDHCGACGIDCDLGTCSAGTCTCAPEATMCGAGCAVLETNSNNCGACGTVCGTGELCRESACLVLNATCATATPITADITILDEDIAEGDAPARGDGCGFGSGSKALYYAVTVPAGQFVRATATSGTSLVIFVQDACGDVGCTDSSTSEEMTVDNSMGAADRTFYIGVRGSRSTTGIFDMAFTYTTPVIATNDNDTCATATVITTDTTIVGGDIALGGARPTGTGCGFGSGATALYYEVSVPAGQRARVIANSSADLVVFSQDACSDTTCTDSSDFPEELTINNVLGTATRTEYIGVRGYSDTTTGTFDLTAIYTTPVIPTNVSCETATVITADATFRDQATAFGGVRPSANGCGNGSGSNSLYYSVTVPAGERVVVTTSPGGDIVLFELAMCGAATCVAATDSSPETLTYTNATAAAVTHVFGVRPYGGTSTPDFGIRFTYSTPVIAANASCETATVVTANATFMDQATADGGMRPSATDCGNGAGSSSLYYAVTIPAGDRVVVTTSPGGDIVLYELAMCGAAACVAATDTTPETLTYSNSTATPVTHIFGVRPYGGTSTPDFGITFTYSTP